LRWFAWNYVGGHKKIKMDVNARILEALLCQQVQTFIQA